MRFYKRILIILSIFLFAGVGCAKKQIPLKPITLTYWGTADNEKIFQEFIKEYKKTHPNVDLVYKKFDKDSYYKELLDALAEDRGPDIFSIPVEDLVKFKTKLLPMPKVLEIVKINPKTKIPFVQKTKTITFRKARNDYFDIIYERMIMDYKFYDSKSDTTKTEKRIFGLPLSFDTLVMFYNKDIFDKFDIKQAPSNWFNFREVVKSITQRDQVNNIITSGAALGTSGNIEHFQEILFLLMLQNGTQFLTKDGSEIIFNRVPLNVSVSEPPALNAIQFYLDFALPYKETYTWNDKMPNSLDAFIQGKTAIYFGYLKDLDVIKKRAPKLNIGIAKVPQIQGNPVVNYAKFNFEVVSKKSKNPEQAWDFLIFISNIDNMEKYMEKTKSPTPLRALLDKEKKDPLLRVVAEQTLTAKNWFKGSDYNKIIDIFANMIEDIHKGKYENLSEALNKTVEQVRQVY